MEKICSRNGHNSMNLTICKAIEIISKINQANGDTNSGIFKFNNDKSLSKRMYNDE